jgi:hypothetical protein
MPVDQFGDDRELEEGNDEPDVDDEPSLGSSNDHHGNGTSYINWTDIIDAEGHDDDLEPSLGWTEQFGKGDDGQWGGSADYEDCRWLPQLDRSQVSI